MEQPNEKEKKGDSKRKHADKEEKKEKKGKQKKRKVHNEDVEEDAQESVSSPMETDTAAGGVLSWDDFSATAPVPPVFLVVQEYKYMYMYRYT